MNEKPMSFDLAGINAAVISEGIESTPSYFQHHITPNSHTNTPYVVLPDGRLILRSPEDKRGDFCDGTARLYAEQNNGLFFPANGGEFKMRDFLQALKFLGSNKRESMSQELEQKLKALFENPESWKELEAEANHIPIVRPAFYTSDCHDGSMNHFVGLQGELEFGKANKYGKGKLMLVLDPNFAIHNLGIVGRVITDEMHLVSRRNAEYINAYLKGAEHNIQRKYEKRGMSVKIGTKFKDDKENYGSLNFWLMSNYLNVDLSFRHEVVRMDQREFQPVASSETMMNIWRVLTREIRKIETGLNRDDEERTPDHIRALLARTDETESFF